MGVRNAPPHAGSMLESLRGLGYVPPTALADLVDNSIAANASAVAVHLEWAGPESWVRIVDDGDGMDDAAQVLVKVRCVLLLANATDIEVLGCTRSGEYRP